ncbi:MAG: protein kinase, partial [Chloroflexi bacterium]|nr:protein kinase [Chloroflexota bacterium]
RARFQQEAETVARLVHPNILPIFDYGQHGDIPYIVMPLISGGTLRDWLARRVTLARALTVLSRILQALDYAHAQGVVHRDIKPSNILMSQGDWPLLTDFGIAKLIEPSLRITRSGTTMVGTPEYMAPEQSQAGSVDHRADIYAMGVVLYEVLTGRLPFQGPTPVAVILQHVKDPPPPPTSIRPELSPIWDQICARTLAKDPADRFPTARAMDEALQAVLRRLERESAQGRSDVGGGDPRALFASASRALAEGDWQRVISLCGQILELDPVNAEALRLLNQAHEALRRQREQRQAEQVNDLLRQAEAALTAERFTEAAQWFEEAHALGAAQAAEGLERVRQAREHARLYAAAREALAHERWSEAAAHLDRLAAQAPGYRDVAVLRVQVSQAEQAAQLATLYDQGLVALRARDWPRAITLLRQVTQVAPQYRDAATRLTEAEQAQQVAPQLANARATLAAGRPQEAVVLLETVVRAAPLVAEARTLLAQAQASANQVPPPHVEEDATRTRRDWSIPPTAGLPSTQEMATRPLDTTFGVGREEATPSPRRPVWPFLAAGLGVVLLLGVLAGPRLLAGIMPQPEPTAVATPVPTPPPAPTAIPEPTAADLFPACETAVVAATWDEAVQACEQVRAKDPSFAGLADALATAYVNQGKRQLDQPDGLSAAAEAFDQALAVKPDDPEALKQRQLLTAYREGAAALEAGDFQLAADRFQQVFDTDAQYREGAVDGGARQRLAEALLASGAAALQEGRYPEAQARCERVLDLLGSSAEAETCRTTAVEAQRPPTAVPTAVPTPVPARQAPAQQVAPPQPQRPAPQPTQ